MGRAARNKWHHADRTRLAAAVGAAVGPAAINNCELRSEGSVLLRVDYDVAHAAHQRQQRDAGGDGRDGDVERALAAGGPLVPQPHDGRQDEGN